MTPATVYCYKWDLQQADRKNKKSRTFLLFFGVGMKYILFVLVICCFWSCDYYEKRKISSEDILEESLQSFNWNEIDDYPVFISCDSTQTSEIKRACFEQTLSSQIFDDLADARLVVSESLQDTLSLEFSISAIGEIELISLTNGQTEGQLPQLDSLIRLSLDKLPKLLPAIKRGQEVRTVFKLPLIIKTD